MRTAQASLSRFLPLIEWTRFRRRNLNEEIGLSERGVAAFACGDDRQAIVWLLRTNSLANDGRLKAAAAELRVTVPGLSAGRYAVALFDTAAASVRAEQQLAHDGSASIELTAEFAADLVLALRRLD
jgi:mannan endo-1,4-beta-mannosidase